MKKLKLIFAGLMLFSVMGMSMQAISAAPVPMCNCLTSQTGQYGVDIGGVCQTSVDCGIRI